MEAPFVLLTTDFSETAEAAYPLAARLAKVMDLPVHVLHVLDTAAHLGFEEYQDPGDWIEDVIAFVETRMGYLLDRLRGDYDVAFEGSIAQGQIAPTIAEVAQTAAYVVTASHGTSGFRRFFPGSVALRLAHTSPAPLLVVPPNAPARTPMRAVFATDLGLPARETVREFSALAVAASLEVELLHADAEPTLLAMVRDEALPLPEAGSYKARRAWVLAELEQQVAALAADGVVATAHMEPAGRAAPTIVERALEIDADWIVMTSRGRGRLARAWMGSVTDEVLRRSPLPVLIMKGETR